jgi:hypothetical protein
VRPGATSEGSIARFRMVNGQSHSVIYPLSPSSEESLFAVGVVKGGSTLLQQILLDLQSYSSRSVLPIHSRFFASGIPLNDVVEDMDSLFQQPGYIFGTFRWLPQRLYIPALENHKTILLVRDPRDMLVSAYYSFKESHGIPKTGSVRIRALRHRELLQDVTLDDYVRRTADRLKPRYFKLMTLLTAEKTLLRRYEDIIFDKENFVGDIAEYFEMDVAPAKIAAIARKHDIMPETETPSQHIRQVKPRNFESKLSPGTVEEINHKLRAILCEFDYR